MCKHNARIMGLEGIRMKAEGGGGLGGRPPSIFKHNNRTMGLEGIRLQDSRFHKATKLEIKIKRK